MEDFARKNFYEMLGVERLATTDEIKEAYRGIARVFHPDSNFFDDIIEVDLSSEHNDKFKMVTAAYHTLVDSAKRAAYDETLPPELRGWEEEGEEIGFVNIGGKKYYYTEDGDIRVKDASSAPTWNSFGKIKAEDEERAVDKVEMKEVQEVTIEDLEEEQALNSTSSRWGSGSHDSIPIEVCTKVALPKFNPIMIALCVGIFVLVGLPVTILIFR